MIGLNVFKEYFKDYAEQYVLIGGAYSGIWPQVLAVRSGWRLREPGQEYRSASILSF